MSAKKKSASSASAAKSSADPVTSREIISTAQIKTAAGTPVTWTAFRTVGMPAGAPADCYLSTLPDNTPDDTPNSYNLAAIAAQCKVRELTLTAIDRDVVYYVTPAGGEEQRIPISRGEPFTVPPLGAGSEKNSVVLTFDGDYCTIEAVPTKPPTATPEVTDDNIFPPPPLPNHDED